MNYPVYCLRFDRTGRYFITGADDFLLKVFYLGAGQSFLVCTLRGHAGVINDIDVSWDNCFLATASDDGDVRVWGLKTGCPIAILRGHKGGANMVSCQREEYNKTAPGQFVFNDLIDEGVKLLSKYQHGSIQEEHHGPGTRSRRGAINVICVARCPLGKQFVTGSDDAIWIESKPLLKLMGHVSTITDLAYSNAGDRILSASQSDGVVRLWNIGIAALAGSGDKSVFKDKRVTQIVIKLTNPFSKQPSQPTRRRKGSAARNASSKPGSQFLCLWDSKSGQCLIGISGAHTLNCQVVIPHPMDASIFCTGSIDGTVKVWDWTQGKCIFSHRNKVELGPPDPKKPSFAGYLDGSFSPDGSAIVLTDECGQITVLDSISKEDNPPNSGNSLKWMREQYFANDYYDLAYDRNGYCIERGSGRPPHLAP
ncbi:WD40 repeat-like protein, partial [Fragilariopsis cylindrus CCMP1102]